MGPDNSQWSIFRHGDEYLLIMGKCVVRSSVPDVEIGFTGYPSGCPNITYGLGIVKRGMVVKIRYKQKRLYWSTITSKSRDALK